MSNWIWSFVAIVSLLSHAWLFLTPWRVPHQRCGWIQCPRLLVPHHLPEFVQIHVQCISDSIQPSHSLIPSSLSEISDSFCRAKLAPFYSFYFSFSLKTLFSSIPVVFMSFFVLILSLSGSAHLKNISIKVIAHLKNTTSKKLKICESLRKMHRF